MEGVILRDKIIARIFSFFIIVSSISLCIYNKFLKPVGYEYEIIALNLLNNRGYSGAFLTNRPEPTAFMCPFYPFLLYLNFKLFGKNNYLFIQILQTVLIAMIPVLVFLTFRLLYRKNNFWILVMFLLDFPYFLFSGYIGVPVLLSFLIALTIFLTAKLSLESSPKLQVLMGIIGGLGLLTDPVFLLTLVPCLIYLFIKMKEKWRISIPVILILIIIFPWLYRNYNLFNAIILKNQAGLNLFLGNNPYATGGIYDKEGDGYPLTVKKCLKEDTLEFYKLNEYQRDRMLYKFALKYIKETLRNEPLKYFSLKLNCLLSYWCGNAWRIRYEEILKSRGISPSFKKFFLLVLLSSILLFITMVIGIVKRDSVEFKWLLLSIIILNMGLYTLTHGHTFTRYRMYIDSIIIIFCAQGMSFLCGWLKRRGDVY